MRISEAFPFENIHQAAKRFSVEANGLNQEVLAVFNDQEFLIKPKDSLSTILHSYFMKSHGRYAALVERSYIQSTMTEGQNKRSWQEFVQDSTRMDKTGKNLELLQYAQRWACLMEGWRKLYPHDKFWEFADECSFLTDISGHYEILVARGIPILKRFWIHGNELEDWYYRFILRLDLSKS